MTGRGRRVMMTTVGLVAAFLVVSPPPTALAAAGQEQGAAATSDPYPQFLYNGKNRVNPHETTLTAGNVSQLTPFWTANLQGAVFGSVIESGGRVYEGVYRPDGAGTLDALDAKTGQLEWAFPTTAPVVVSAAVANNVVFAGDKAGTLYALDAGRGDVLWEGHAGQAFFDDDTLAVVGGVVYATTLDGTVSAWNASGCGDVVCSPLWTGVTGGLVGGAAVSGGTVFVGSTDGQLYAFSAAGCGASQCSPLWTGTAQGQLWGGVVVANGLVYAGTSDTGKLFAFGASGCGAPTCSPQWVDTAGAGIGFAPAVAYGKVFVGAGSTMIAFPAKCRKSSCGPVWATTVSGYPISIVANGVVYAGIVGGGAVAFDAATGKVLWQVATSASVNTGPAVANGVLYVPETFGNAVLAYHLQRVAGAG